MADDNDHRYKGMKEAEDENATRTVSSGRYQSSIRTAVHYAVWTLVILIFWPAALLLRGLARLRRYE